MKWYWWLLIGLLIASGLWVWYLVSDKKPDMAKVREAKAEKAALKVEPSPETDANSVSTSV